MRKTVLFAILFLTLTIADAQNKNIGTEKSLNSYKSKINAPDFIELLEKGKNYTKKDSTILYIFNEFPEGLRNDNNSFRCSFEIYKFKKNLYKDESLQYKYLDSVSSTYYVFRNQKISYKEISWKKKGIKETLEIYYYRNGKPRNVYSKRTNTNWYFDKEGTIVNSVLFEEEKKEFIFEKIKFTLEEQIKIKEDLIKIIKNNKILGSKWFNDYTISDWKIVDKIKKYFKALFNTEIDFYLYGFSSSGIIFYSEDDYYALTNLITKLET